MTGSVFSTFRRLRRDEGGAALVEFALILPMALVIFGVVIEGSRLFWSYQATIAGVRDAARYVGRSVQTDICNTGGTLSDWSATLEDIVRESSDGSELFPTTIKVTSVNATLECVAGDFRLTATPIATVTAILEITYPFQGLFTFAGVSLPTATTTVADSSRIFGA
ncbi:TadE-like protein [Litoreibacter ponti]|uniref:TadE-like protein n=1 Tax=Litoreibacter ponti TaxID=1510457 RepID=A0A2T6BF24_9RHOB|nr:TadE family protein [Litoreibacter ponti]PTX54649.1 TadE-like protein [Litoreibacter ponti]